MGACHVPHTARAFILRRYTVFRPLSQIEDGPSGIGQVSLCLLCPNLCLRIFLFLGEFIFKKDL